MHDNLSSHGSVFKLNTAYVDLDHCLSSQEEFLKKINFHPFFSVSCEQFWHHSWSICKVTEEFEKYGHPPPSPPTNRVFSVTQF